jgi:acetyl-CoA carboxylase biotin carboxyl carrier protein
MSEDRQDRDVAFIRALAELLRDNELTELQVRREDAGEGGLDVRLARQAPAAPAAPLAAPVAVAPGPEAPPPAAEAAETPPGAEDPALLPGAVTSPMVGTVYLAPEPGAAPYVGVGDEVAEGQTLLIVEAMKTMNQIPAPRAGRVSRILVENGAPVEFGAPLMVVD